MPVYRSHFSSESAQPDIGRRHSLAKSFPSSLKLSPAADEHDNEENVMNFANDLSHLKSRLKSNKKRTAPRTPPTARVSLVSNPSMSLFDTSSPIYTKPSAQKLQSAGGASGVPQDETRYCSKRGCRTIVRGKDWRMCDKCRQKTREASSKRREKARLARRESLSGSGKDMQDTNNPLAYIFKEKSLKLYMNQLRAKGLLCPAEDALGKRKAGDGLVGAQVVKKTKLIDGPNEYQTAEEFYMEVRRAIAEAADATFKGHFFTIQSLSEEATKSRARREVGKMMDATGLQLRTDENPTAKCHMVNNQLACRLEYRCACKQSCEGRLVFKIEKVLEGILPGEKVTVRMKHFV